VSATIGGSVRGDLAQQGYVVLPAAAVGDGALADPWLLVERLVGERPLVLERQPIRKVDGGRSFASTSVMTPLHTDSQDFLGAPPAIQLMACRARASRGGQTLLLDTWELTRRIERDEPGLSAALFTIVREIPFYFGPVVGPTIARKGAALCFTASPMPPRDDIGRALARFIDEAPVIELSIAAGETLLVDNHRMLHGRAAFDGAEREFMRILAWLERPIAVNERWRAHAQVSSVIAGASPEAVTRFRVVMELLSGVPPAKLAAREGVSEETLYRWRTQALAAARRALAD
jgi:gamma-butyrobetaine dioxygenase